MAPDTTAPGWRKATTSGGNGGDCVELASTLDAMRDSKNPNGPVLRLPLLPFLDQIKADGFHHQP